MSDSENSNKYDLMNKEPTFDFHDPSTIHDRVLIVDGIKFYVQSGYLSVWSTYFRTLCNSHFKENIEEIELKDVSAEDFNVFLQVIYPGFFKVEASHIETLIDLSYRFMAPNVLELSKKFVEKNFHQMDKIMLLAVAAKHGMENLKKKSLDSVMENIVIYNQLDLLKIACEYKLEKFKNRVVKLIMINIKNFNPIELLKLAFKHNAENLKKKLRSLIYTADRIELYYQCNECTDRIQRLGCTHTPVKSMPLTRNALIAEHIDDILLLPKNIKDFVIISSISPI